MQSFKATVFRTCAFFTAASLCYTVLMVFFAPESGTASLSALYRMLLEDYGLLFAYAVVFGVSYLIFDWKGIPAAARRAMHIVILYLTMLLVFFGMASVADDTRAKVLFALMASFVFLVLYVLGFLAEYLYRKHNGSGRKPQE